ncbi:MAG TPA: hypothetical protein DEQ61_23450, partial [Streptomyces sp.]|nr:hypothetical protein [Streptomyces sp.]
MATVRTSSAGQPVAGQPAAARLAVLLLADGRLPAGAYAQSAGLEPAVAGGLTSGRIPEYLTARL